MRGLAAVDLGVVTDSHKTINSLLSRTSQEHETFLVTGEGEPVIVMFSVNEYQEKDFITRKLDEEDLDFVLGEYEKELENII